MDNTRRRVSFLAPVFAEIAAPVVDALRERAKDAAGVDLHDVPCPVCSATVAVWVNRRLYAPGPVLGRPLGGGVGDDVALRCPGCGRTWSASGRSVGRNLYNGRPAIRVELA
jgi:hypothetical protein